MIQRFFLDGIDLQRGWVRVAEAVKFPALIRADETEPRLPLANMAVPRTQIAMYFACGFGFPPPCLVKRAVFWRVVRSPMTNP